MKAFIRQDKTLFKFYSHSQDFSCEVFADSGIKITERWGSKWSQDIQASFIRLANNVFEEVTGEKLDHDDIVYVNQ